MVIYNFKNDYSEGAHPNILQALLKNNFDQQNGYSQDDYCNEAIDILRGKLNNYNADIHFVTGGTQANLLVISSVLKSFESVISATTAHINIHETGAIEYTGHKINLVESENGKLSPEKIKPVLEFHTDEHMVKPRMVYISNSTEIGSIYNKKELEELYTFCQSHNLILYLDGARIGSALCSRQNDLSFADLSKLVDIFYIGGTKNGALLGEAVVINNVELQRNFRFYMKQKGALLAKGRLFGLQFSELFKDDLFFKLAKHANDMAFKLRQGIINLGYKFFVESSSNQIFPILPNCVIDVIGKKYGFFVWAKLDNEMSAIRLVTSWATKEENVESFISELREITRHKI